MRKQAASTATIIAAACLAYAGVAPAAAVAGIGSQPNALQKIILEKHDDLRLLRIQTSHPPVFTVLRLQSPQRVIIDIADARLAANLQVPQGGRDNLVADVALSALQGPQGSVGRVSVTVAQDAEIDVQAVGQEVILRSSRGQAGEKRAPPRTPAANAKPADAAVTPIQSTRNTPMQRTLAAVTGLGSDGYVLKLSAPTQYRTHVLSAPPRFVIDLVDVQAQPEAMGSAPELERVAQVRLGQQAHTLRVVFDLREAGTQARVQSSAEGLTVQFFAPPKATPKIKVAAEQAGPGVISRIEFVRTATSAGRIMVHARGTLTATLGPLQGGVQTLRFREARLADGQERTLDARALKTAVQLVSTYQATPKEVVVVTRMDPGARTQLHRTEQGWTWEVLAGRAAPKMVAQAEGGAREPDSDDFADGPRVRVAAPQTAAFVAEGKAVVTSAPGPQHMDQRISLDVKDADILNVLRLISEETGENIVASDEVHGKVTLRLRNVPASQALDTILHTKGLDRVRQNNILRIATAASIQQERDLEVARRRSEAEVEETVIRMVPVNYAHADEVVDQIRPMLSERGTLQVDKRTNTLILQDVVEIVDRLARLTRSLDRQTPLVMIQARIVEAQTIHLQDLGVQWGGTAGRVGNATGLLSPGTFVATGAADAPINNQDAGLPRPARFAVNLPARLNGAGGGLGFILGSAGGGTLLNLRLSAMESNGTAKIISSPEVATLDNKTATISQGVEIPISVVSLAGVNVRFVPANLQLEVTPHVTNDGTVLLKIATEKAEPDFTRLGAGGDPTIQRRRAKTEVLVRDGDTSVIGGIYTRSTSNLSNEIPYLSKIPILGHLFRSRRAQDLRNELLVFITPHIINRGESVIVPGGLDNPPAEQAE